MAQVWTKDRQTAKTVLNLGWLLRNHAQVDSIRIETSEYPKNGDCFMITQLRDGRMYTTWWADRSVCRDWLRRPSFRHCPLDWFGEKTYC